LSVISNLLKRVKKREHSTDLEILGMGNEYSLDYVEIALGS
jgi:hypothetical protein